MRSVLSQLLSLSGSTETLQTPDALADLSAESLPRHDHIGTFHAQYNEKSPRTATGDAENDSMKQTLFS